MEEKPYIVDSTNKRIVTNVQRPASVYMLAAGLFLGSLYVY